MFKEKPELKPFLARSGLTKFAAALEPLCVPAVCFEEAARSSRAGSSRLGGAPDLPVEIEWPWRAAYEHGEQVAERLLYLDPGQVAAFAAPMPLAFLCQLDLEEVARAGDLGARLPDRGRLLIFWDALCGAWIHSTHSCRVLWDRSPRGTLAERRAPDERAVVDAIVPPAGLYPRKPIEPRSIWSMPDKLLLKELVADEGLHIALDDEYYEDVWEDLLDRGATILESGAEVLPHRLLGWPIPEQWDPRYEAAASARGVLRFFDRSPTPEERKACVADMHRWTLLFQLGLNDLWSEYAEGTVYFVMREEDLEARNFDRVRAIYQQT
jgi:hypothetical protein